MAHIGDHSWHDTLTFRDSVREQIQSCASLEAAAQSLVETIYREFSDSVVLARCFITIPLGTLPARIREFVSELAENKSSAAQLADDTPVLTLLGTCGARDKWNSRHSSQGHSGIPLISASFVDSIPMIARLLKELEVDLNWLSDEEKTGFTEKEMGGGWVGSFHVRDAATAVDHQGRKIITAQDFVAQNGIQTVFGLGGIYPRGALFTLVVFTHEIIEKERLADFVPLVPLIKVSTSSLLEEGKIFA